MFQLLVVGQTELSRHWTCFSCQFWVRQSCQEIEHVLATVAALLLCKKNICCSSSSIKELLSPEARGLFQSYLVLTPNASMRLWKWMTFKLLKHPVRISSSISIVTQVTCGCLQFTLDMWSEQTLLCGQYFLEYHEYFTFLLSFRVNICYASYSYILISFSNPSSAKRLKQFKEIKT